MTNQRRLPEELLTPSDCRESSNKFLNNLYTTQTTTELYQRRCGASAYVTDIRGCFETVFVTEDKEFFKENLISALYRDTLISEKKHRNKIINSLTKVVVNGDNL